jgi:hypothetical protein
MPAVEPEIDQFVMAITSAEGLAYRSHQLARVTACAVELNSYENGRTQMRKISLFAVAATLVATGFGVWAASTTNARVVPSIGQGIEPFQLMMNAKDLPAQHYDDFSMVFI